MLVQRVVFFFAVALPMSRARAQSLPVPGARERAVTSTRERAVLEILNDSIVGARYGRWFWELQPVRSVAPGQPPTGIPRSIGLCGNSITGWASKMELRGYVARLFTAYGLQPASEVACDLPGVKTRFDVLASDAKLAVKIDGILRAESPGMPPVAEPDGPLGDDQIATMEAADWRVLCVPLKELEILGCDQVRTNVPFLARVVELLNDATSGDDVDVSPLVRGWEERWQLRPLEATAIPKSASFDAVTARLEVRAATRLEWTIQGGAAVRNQKGPNEWRRPSTPASTLGQITMVALHVEASGPASGQGSGLRLRLTQGSLAIESATPQILAPATFDASKPFTLTADFEAGTYQVFPDVSVAVTR